MEIFERKGSWYVAGKGRPYPTKAKAEASTEASTGVLLPLPEVREYDSIEEAIKGEDDLIAEED